MYDSEEVHAVSEGKTDEKFESLTTQSFLLAYQEDAYCRLLAEKGDASDSQYFYDEFGILSRRARLERATENVVPSSF